MSLKQKIHSIFQEYLKDLARVYGKNTSLFVDFPIKKIDAVLDEASLQVVEMQRKTVKEFQKITQEIRKDNKPAVKLLRDQSYYGGKIDGLLWVLALLDGEVQPKKIDVVEGMDRIERRESLGEAKT